MSLVCLSFSHQDAPLAFRERVHFDADAVANTCARFRTGDEGPSRIVEYALLSTCNRTEFYAFTKSDEPQTDEALVKELVGFVADARDVDEAELDHYGRWLYGADVVQHLSRVACGLESVVIGEPQILGQVGDTMRLAASLNSSGAVLSRLFTDAIRAGRRARNETDINAMSLNVSAAAVNLVVRRLGSLTDRTVVLLGAGDMADLALERLRERGAGRILVVNRTIDRAEELALKYGGRAFVYEQLNSALAEADVLITSTGAPHTLVSKEMVALAMVSRPDRPMVILDIAVPRDVEEGVEEVSGVFRCDVDDLHDSTEQAAAVRSGQVPLVEQIVNEEVNNFLAWYRSIGVESVVAGLHQRADRIRRAELDRLAGHLGPGVAAADRDRLTEADWEVIDRFSKALVKKLLHDPTVQLRANYDTRGGVDHAEAVRQLFLLDEPTDDPAGEANR